MSTGRMEAISKRSKSQHSNALGDPTRATNIQPSSEPPATLDTGYGTGSSGYGSGSSGYGSGSSDLFASATREPHGMPNPQSRSARSILADSGIGASMSTSASSSSTPSTTLEPHGMPKPQSRSVPSATREPHGMPKPQSRSVPSVMGDSGIGASMTTSASSSSQSRSSQRRTSAQSSTAASVLEDSAFDSLSTLSSMSTMSSISKLNHTKRRLESQLSRISEKRPSLNFDDTKNVKKVGKIKIPKVNSKEIETIEDTLFFLFILTLYASHMCSNSNPTITSTELAASGLVLGDDLKSVFCPHCTVEMELPRISTNMLALHLVYSRECELAKTLLQLRERSLEILTSSGDGTSKLKHSSHEAEGSSEAEGLKVDFIEEVPAVLVTVSGAEYGADEMAENDGSSAEERIRRQYEQIASKLNKHELEIAKFHSKTNQNSNDTSCEVSRRFTFIKHKQPDNPRVRLLVSRGHYLHEGKRNLELRCAFCNFKKVFKQEMITSSEVASALDKEHIKNNCGHLLGSGNSNNKPDIWNTVGFDYGRVVDASELLSEESLNGVNQHASLGINLQLSKHTEMAVAARRIATFLTYPYKAPKHPDVLSEAGYFYEGEGDSVTCFSCGIKSADWTASCNVWARHARSSIRCPFVILQKGQSFIDDVIAEHGPYRSNKPDDRINNVTTRMLRPRMDSQPVQKALDMGLNRESVRTVVGNRIKRGESDFKYVAEIVRAVNDLAIPDSQLPGSELISLALPKMIKPPEEPTVAAEDNTVPAEDVDEEMETDSQTDSTDVETSAATVEGQKEGEAIESTDFAVKSNQIRNQLTCKICMTDIVSIIFLPCGHLACCSTCSAAMTSCPLCRKEVNGTIKVNF